MSTTTATRRLVLDALDATQLQLMEQTDDSIHYRSLGPLGDAATEALVPSELLADLWSLRDQRRRQEDEAWRRSEDTEDDGTEWPAWDDTIDYVSGSWFRADGELKGWAS